MAFHVRQSFSLGKGVRLSTGSRGTTLSFHHGSHRSGGKSSGTSFIGNVLIWSFAICIFPILMAVAAVKVLIKRHNGDYSMTLWEKISFYAFAVVLFPITLSVWFYKSEKIRLNKRDKLIIIGIFFVIMLAATALSTPDEPEVTAEQQKITEARQILEEKESDAFLASLKAQTDDEAEQKGDNGTAVLKLTPTPSEDMGEDVSRAAVPTSDPTPVVDEVPPQSESETIVYITPAGEHYHSENCRYAKGDDVTAITVSEAEKMGLTPCGVCYK